MASLKHILFTFFLLILSLPGISQVDSLPSIFDLLYRDTILHLTVETDLKKFVNNKVKETYQPAIITYHTNEGDIVTWTVKIKARGNIRKKVCYYPPYKIKFPKKELKTKGLEPEYNDIKVVTGCSNSSEADQYVLKEYLAYQLYQEISEYSLRTQIVEIQYIDSKKSKKNFKTYGFLIEETKQLAARFNGRISKPSYISNKYVVPEILDEVSVFQYMIGNSDYGIANHHNILLIASQDFSKPFPVPYDFDYSGFVNTHYAVPAVNWPIEEVTDRYFMGVCRDDESYDIVVEKFLQKKEGLLKMIKEFPYLSKKERKWVLNYLDDFFELIEKPAAFKNIISKECMVIK